MAANCVGLPRSAAVTLPKPPAERGAPGIPDSRQGAEFQQGSESARVALGTDEETGPSRCRVPGTATARAQVAFRSAIAVPGVFRGVNARRGDGNGRCSTRAGKPEEHHDRGRKPVANRSAPDISTYCSTRQAFDGAKRGLSNRQHPLILGCGQTGVKCKPQRLAAKTGNCGPGTATFSLEAEAVYWAVRGGLAPEHGELKGRADRAI